LRRPPDRGSRRACQRGKPRRGDFEGLERLDSLVGDSANSPAFGYVGMTWNSARAGGKKRRIEQDGAVFLDIFGLPDRRTAWVQTGRPTHAAAVASFRERVSTSLESCENPISRSWRTGDLAR